MRRSLVFLSLAMQVCLHVFPVSGVSAAGGPFTDIDAGHPSFSALSYLKDKGVIDGFPDGSFQPDRKVNRAEAAKILVRSLGLATSSGSTLSFRDMRVERWYTPYVAAAFTRGIVSGYPDRTFRPTRAIVRVEGLKMILNAYDFRPDDPAAADVSLFTDTVAMPSSAWFQPYVSYAIRKNLIEPVSAAHFGGGQAMTRGEFAQVMYRLLLIREQSLSAYKLELEEGIASFYGKAFYGRKTSSGVVFTAGLPTAAHRTLPFGTMVEVLHAKTGRGTLVQIQDRGPYVDGRVIDLNEYAFQRLENLSTGVFPVRLNITGVADLIREMDIPMDTFFDPSRSMGLSLDQPLPATLIENGVHVFSGTVPGKATFVTAVLKRANQAQHGQEEHGHEEYVSVAPVVNHQFTMSLHTPASGTYTLNLLPNNVGVGEAKITVVPQKVFSTLLAPASEFAPRSVGVTSADREIKVRWEDTVNTLFRIRLGGAVLYVSGTKSVSLPREAFTTLAPGKTTLVVEGAQASGANPLTITSGFRSSAPVDAHVVRNEYQINEPDNITVDSFSTFHDGVSLRLTGTVKVVTEGTAWVTFPSGKTTSVSIGSGPTLNPGDKFNFTLPVTEAGTYIIEINDTSNEAIFNMPFYQPQTLPVLENERDAAARVFGEGLHDAPAQVSRILDAINRARSSVGALPLTSDSVATSIANERTSDMVERNYVSHTAPDGKTIADIQQRRQLTGSIGENIAVDANALAALEGLLRSPLHRDALLSPAFDRIGIGLSTIKTGQVIMTQILLGK